MYGNLYALAVEIVVLVIVSALVYLILRLIAKSRPDGYLARPHGVSNVWMLVNCQLIGFLLVFLMFFAQKKMLSGNWYIFNIVLRVFSGLFVGKMLGRLAGNTVRKRLPQSILNDTRFFLRLNGSLFWISLFISLVVLAGIYFACYKA